MSVFHYRRYKNEEARFDAYIEDTVLRAAGVVEDDEPTEYSHFAYMQRFEREATGEFTAEERHAIRLAIGLGPYCATDELGSSPDPSRSRVSSGEETTDG